MDNTYENFIGLSSLSKTIRNELRPTESTLRHIRENGVITEGEVKAENRGKMIEIMDDYYRTYIAERLSQLENVDWKQLFQAFEKRKEKLSNQGKKEIDDLYKKMREDVVKCLSDDDRFKNMFQAELIKWLPEFVKTHSEYSPEAKQEKLEVIGLFSRFGTAFTNYFSSRKNMFSKEAIAPAIGYRIVHVNSAIFYDNLCAFRRIKKTVPQMINEMEKEIGTEIKIKTSLDHIYTEDYYGSLLLQPSIDQYNEICGYVNKKMNLYCQQNKIDRKPFRMQKMQKQILGISKSSFEIPQMIQTDQEAYDLLEKFLLNVQEQEILDRLCDIGENAGSYDLNKIYIASDMYESISSYMTGKWYDFQNGLVAYYGAKTSGKPEQKGKKIDKKIKEDKYKSLSDIDELFATYILDGVETEKNAKEEDKYKTAKSYIAEAVNIIDCWKQRRKGTADTAQKNKITPPIYDASVKLLESSDKISEIKEILDLFMDLYHWCKMFATVDSEELDASFYSELKAIYEELEKVVTIYNRIRNYVTQKPFQTEKMKLYFNTPTIGDGWSLSKEYANDAILLTRDGKYYLGIFNAKNKPDKKLMKGCVCSSKVNDYKKMVYYVLPGPNKMLPKVFLTSKSGQENYRPSDYILSGYKTGKHKKSGGMFDLAFCHDLIDYFKECIKQHLEWRKFNFHFSETNSYADVSEFYKEVSEQGYRLDWTYISEETINQLDEAGQLYLFQIYNKDFSEKSSGTDNLHTMYLKNLFSEENLKDIVLQLNGGAELFYRKSSIKEPIIHKKGEYLVNKSIEKNGVKIPIPDVEYVEICDYLNHRERKETMSESAWTWYQKIEKSEMRVIHKARHDIVKDYRYTMDKFFLHLPITINYKAGDPQLNELNDRVREYIAKTDDLHIIGIDRGERNLLYVSVIDSHGAIKEQRSFNIVNQFDYQKKLKNQEDLRKKARRSWQEIGKIKEIKTGYLSMVIHEITELMLKYNAIIVMEDLNYGFKRGRFKIERQVYQKFENMLLDKLSYLVSKQKKVDEPGGLLRGYQLAYPPASKQNAGTQCGFVFYVPAGYTSKIDPTTGFVDLFQFRNYKSRETGKEFLCKFDEIRYDKKQGLFKFTFDYDNFISYNTTLAKTKWEVYTYGERVERVSRYGENEEEKGKQPDILEAENRKRKYTTRVVDITQKMKAAFLDANINYEDEHDLLPDIEMLDVNQDKEAISNLVHLFQLTVQMRNSIPNSDYDRLISPVLNENGIFFDSQMYKESENISEEKLPQDADANGAYCIALKGLYKVNKIKENWSKTIKQKQWLELLRIGHREWFDFIQNKGYK